MSQWKSIAEWPEGTTSDSYGRCRSEDTHDTRNQALGVCVLLNKWGFGGDGRTFPVKTWIEEVK